MKGQGKKGCKRSTFINSFFTKGGVETIASPFSVSTTYANSYCSGDGSGDSGDRRDRNLGGNDDDYSYSEGTGCSAKGTFVRDSFGGSYCDGSRYLETLDPLEDFNEEMNGIVCEEIWDGKSGSSLYTSTAYKVLTQSSVCDLSMYPSKCPDPHGLLRQYNHNFKKAISLAKMGIIYEPVKSGFPFISFSIGLIFVSACMIGASFYVKNREVKNPVERQMAAAQKALEEDMQVDDDDIKPSPSNQSSASKMSSSPLKEEVVGIKPVLLQFGSSDDSPTKSASVADPGPAPEVAKTTSWAGSVVSRVRSLVHSDPEEQARKAQAKAQAEEEAAQAYREIQDAPLFTSPSSASNCPGCNPEEEEVEEGASAVEQESVQEQSQQEESMSESHAGNVSTSAVSPVRLVEESLATEFSASQATEETSEIQTAPSTGSTSLFGKLRKK